MVGLGKSGVPSKGMWAKSLTFSTVETKETLNLMGICKTTLAVDGLEIRRSPVDMDNIPLFTVVYTSQLVQDFFHQQ